MVADQFRCGITTDEEVICDPGEDGSEAVR
jgi:hypothetical protein